MDKLDLIIYTAGGVLTATFLYILWSYGKNLKSSPRELYILFLSKITEYSAYGAMNLAFILYLSADVGLGDISAGSYIGVWSILLTIGTMLVGAVCDALGIKKTLLLGTIVLVISRILLPFSHNIYLVTLFSFIPMAFGMALLSPVLSVGIKKYTKKETMALGFALFYTLMNVGWAIGAWIFDTVRGALGEHVFINLPLIPMQLSTYQVIFLIALALTIPNILIVSLIREGVTMTENGIKKVETKKMVAIEGEGFFTTIGKVAKDASIETIKIFKQVITEKSFWVFIFMLGVLIFVKLVFYHFHYTFPKYGIRVLGEGQKIGSIFGVLNPVMIVFLAPLMAHFTRKIKSYKMLLIGTLISSGSIFIATIPQEFFRPLMETWFGLLIFERWLHVPTEMQSPLFLSLVFMVIFFTIGEAIWSPRLMQFTAEIAPKGKEGSYIALSYLPYFAGKLIVGPFSGWLVATYTPKDATSYPQHYMVWVWIGGMALISPLGLLLFKKLFNKADDEQEAEMALLKKKQESGEIAQDHDEEEIVTA